MPRKPKVKIEIGNIESLQSLCEDIYHDLYTQRTQVIRDLSRMLQQVSLEDDHSVYQVYKTRASLFGVLASNSSTKILLAKLMTSTLSENQSSEAGNEGVTLEQMAMIRKMVNQTNQDSSYN